MAEGLGETRDGLESEITCPLCLSIYQEPKTLPCGHVYCRHPCLTGLARRAGGGRVVKCPECREETPIQNGDVGAFPTAFLINRLKDLHVKIPPAAQTCPKHRDQEVAIYCDTCKEVLCRDCVIGPSSPHRNHDYEYVKEAAGKRRKALLRMVEESKTLQETLSEADVILVERKSEVSVQSDCLSRDIDVKIDSLVKTLTEHLTQQRQRLHAKAVSFTANKLAKIEAQEKIIKLAQSQLSEGVCAIENAFGNLSDLDLLHKSKDLKTRLEHVTTQAKEVSLSPLPCSDNGGLYSFVHVPEALTVLHSEQVFICCGEQASPSKCKFQIEGLRGAEVGQEISLVVSVCSVAGAKCVEEQNVIMEMFYLRDGSMSVVTGTWLRSGDYQIRFTPKNRGRHRISVKVNDAHILGSPMSVFVKIPPQKLDSPVAVISDLARPTGLIFFGKDETLLVCEYGRDQIIIVGKNFRKIGTLVQGLSGPSELTTDSNSNIYVGTIGDGQIHKLDSNGQVLKAVKSFHIRLKTIQCKFPNGCEIFNGKLFMCDSDDHNIKILDKDLKLCQIFGSRGSTLGRFDDPLDLDFDKNGDLYVTEKGNNRVQVLTSDGHPIRQFGSKGQNPGPLKHPVDIKIADNYIFVTDYVNSNVSIFRTTGEYITSFGDGYLFKPEGIAIDLDGFVYVTSHESQIIVF